MKWRRQSYEGAVRLQARSEPRIIGLVCLLLVQLHDKAPAAFIQSTPRRCFRRNQALAWPSMSLRRSNSNGGDVRPDDNDDQLPTGPPPPPFDGSARGLKVFSDPFFYNGSHAEAEMHQLARETYTARTQSVWDVRWEDYESYGGRTRNHVRSSDMSDDGWWAGRYADMIHANRERIKRFYRTASLPERKVWAGRVLSHLYECTFGEAVVDVGTALDPLLLPRPGNEGDRRVVDLSFLDPFRLEEDRAFLRSRTLYVRDAMRTIFAFFRHDVERNKEPGEEPATLIGSPGVGKATLCFLAALYQARTRMVAYYRDGDIEDHASVFVMTPEGDGRSVRVWFTRNVRTSSYYRSGCFRGFNFDLQDCLQIRRRDYLVYVDYPEYTDVDRTLSGTFDYLTTRWGYRFPKNEPFGRRLWVLEGWSRQEMLEALVAIGHRPEVAVDLYSKFGGKIRDVLAWFHEPNWILQSLETRFEVEPVQLIDWYACEKDLVRPRRMGTVFEFEGPYDNSVRETFMRACKYVDSPYLLEKLCDELGSGPFFDAYQFAVRNNIRSAEDMFLECTFHQFVRELKVDLVATIQGVCWSRKEATEAILELNATNVYWAPRMSTFEEVHSALVYNGTMYVFRVASRRMEAYDTTRLETSFLSKVRSRLVFGRTKVCFISPKDRRVMPKDKIAIPEGQCLEFIALEVETCDLEAMKTSVKDLMKELCN